MATGNIMGGPFAEWVTNQIEQRQLSLGKGSGSTPKDLLYQQSKTPWIRLASSVDLLQDEEGAIDILKRLGGLPGINLNEIEGPGAAKNFILQGGAISLEGENNFKQNSGLNLTNQTFNGAYGWGGVTDRGLVPMPGITGASVKFLNNGALTKTEINIKCYSRNQFALIDALYMRPGYSLLLEFGWSTYLQTTSKNGVLTGDDVKLETYDNLYSPALRYLFDPDFTEANQHKLVYKIFQEREARSGNYEGVFGKITNFKWTFNPDGTYDCIVYLTGLGEVIQSLKVNISAGSEEGYYNSKMQEKDKTSSEEDKDIPLIADARKTTINSILFNIYQSTTNPPTTKGASIAKEIFNTVLGSYVYIYNKTKSWTNSDQKGEDQIQDYTIINFPLIDDEGTLTKKDITIPNAILSLGGTQTDDDDNESPQVYITFGCFMAILQKNIIIHNGSNGCPFFTFDMDFDNLEEDKNYIKRLPGQFSSNPLICMVPYDNHNITKKSFSPFLSDGVTPHPIQTMDINFLQVPGNNLNDILQEGANWKADTYLGRLSCIYLNINHIAKVLDATPTDDDGLKSLLDFMNGIIKDMSTSLGSINDIVLKSNAEGTRIRFYEGIPQRFGPNLDKDLPPGKMCRFNTFGFTDGVGGSIVRNLGIDGSISSNFSTMITIGAQSNGNQIAGNATSFSNYNNGIIDRVIPTKVNKEPIIKETADVNKDGTTTNKEQKAWDKAEKKKYDNIVSQATNINKALRAIMDKGDPDAPWYSKLGHWITTWEAGVFEDIYKDRQWYEDDLETLAELNNNYISLMDGIQCQPQSSGGTGQLNAPFFLPFNFNMEIDGMGGIQLMQKFKLDQKILPPTYDKDSVEIIVRGVNHEINGSAWLTKLDTQSTPVSKEIPVSESNPLQNTTTSKSSAPLETPPNPQPPGEELLRMRITRIMDDGTQTLGMMDVLAEDEETILFSLATSELPWLDNKNSISCIPTDNYLVKSHTSGKHGRCFWLIGNEGGGYDFNRLKGNGYTRAAVLIHMAPRAPEWLEGCIGPGLKFNAQNNQKGEQKGTGQYYLNPSKSQSTQAMNKILTELYRVGSFKLEIINVQSPLPNQFNGTVQSLAKTNNRGLLPNAYVKPIK